MSTTLNRDVALEYAGSGGSGGIIFEIQMGLVDRGADLTWCSQYSHEREILFAPLTSMEVRDTRVEGCVLIVHVRPSINLSAQTIENVIGRRRKLLIDMCDGMEAEVRSAVAESQGLVNVAANWLQQELKRSGEDPGPLDLAAQELNEDAVFGEAVQVLLQFSCTTRHSSATIIAALAGGTVHQARGHRFILPPSCQGYHCGLARNSLGRCGRPRP